jgi:acyl-ACP--UDP-N-acetylglucosamine O-acyltransferase
MGNNNKVHQGSVIGALPQDFDFTGEKSEIIIGDNNIIRENVVINRATHTGGKTVIGDNNFLMEGAHISHDTKVGNQCVFGYGTKIAGDCEIGNGVIFSSSVVENAKTRVGEGAMVQAGTTFSKDVPPYIIAGGRPWLMAESIM